MARKRDEPVRLTKIYTRGGDAGETSLGDGTRVSKTDLRVEAYGAVDELNAALGVVLASGASPPVRARLERVQNELFDVGADLSVPVGEGEQRLRIVQDDVDRLERDCDEANEPLEPLTSFVLPGGNLEAANLHVARSVCRRAERRVAALAETEDVNPLALAYLNRLSDLLFILSRLANQDAGTAEPLWRPGGSR